MSIISVSKLIVLAAFDAGNKYLGFAVSSNVNYYKKLQFLLTNDSVIELEKNIYKYETGQKELWYLFEPESSTIFFLSF